MNSETAIVIDFESRTILIGGNLYCGEIKKSVFTVMNYELPRRGILTMHCSANTDEDDNTALFFGLSGTGKTTLSSSSDRCLIGDDAVHQGGAEGALPHNPGAEFGLQGPLVDIPVHASEQFPAVIVDQLAGEND